MRVASVRQTAVLLFALVVGLFGAFPYHLLAAVPFAAAVTLPYPPRPVRIGVAVVSLVVFAVGLGVALGG